MTWAIRTRVIVSIGIYWYMGELVLGYFAMGHFFPVTVLSLPILLLNTRKATSLMFVKCCMKFFILTIGFQVASKKKHMIILL